MHATFLKTVRDFNHSGSSLLMPINLTDNARKVARDFTTIGPDGAGLYGSPQAQRRACST
ncbi:hypothetical protein ACX0MV_02445 [Pseudomonas borbori]